MKHHTRSKPNNNNKVENHPRHQTRPACTPHPHEQKSVDKQFRTQGRGDQTEIVMAGENSEDVVCQWASWGGSWRAKENIENTGEVEEYSADTHQLHHGLHGEEADGGHADPQHTSCDYDDMSDVTEGLASNYTSWGVIC